MHLPIGLKYQPATTPISEEEVLEGKIVSLRELGYLLCRYDEWETQITNRTKRLVMVDFFPAMLVHLAHLMHEGEVPFYMPPSTHEELAVTPEILRICLSHNGGVRTDPPLVFVEADALLDVMEESLLLWNAVTLTADQPDFCTAYDHLVQALEATVNHRDKVLKHLLVRIQPPRADFVPPYDRAAA